MPAVCVSDCGFLVDAGSLSLDWAALGDKGAAVQSVQYYTSLDRGTDGWMHGLDLRLSYTNNTCRTQRVRHEAIIPALSFQMVPGNHWYAGLDLAHSVEAPPEPSVFQPSWASTVRMNHDETESSARSMTWPVPTRAVHGVVEPGQTLHMMAAFAFNIAVYTGADYNSISWPSMVYQYTAAPIAD